MDYGGILSRSWQITWRNKGLWLLGILSGCTGSGGNGGNTSSYQYSAGQVPELDRFLAGIPEETLTLIVVVLALAALLLFVVFFVLGVMAQAGLIAGVAQADETGSVKLGEAWRLGQPAFWRMLGMYALLIVVVLIVAAIVGVFMVVTLGLGAVCLVPLVCLAIPLAIVISAYLPMVQNGIVLERQRVFEAFGRAWSLLRSNFWPLILMAVLLFVIALVAGIAIAAPILIAALPMVALAMSQEPSLTAWLPLIACVVLYLPVAIVLNGIMTTFVSGTWTLTFRRLAGAGMPAVSIPAPG